MSDIDSMDHFLERVEPGGIMPHGQCPDCGSLCYAVDRETILEIAVEKLLNCPAMNEDHEEAETVSARDFATEVLAQKRQHHE